MSRVFDCERTGDGVQPALGQRGERRRPGAVGVIDEAGADVDDVAAALGDHLPDRALGDVEEPGEVDGGDRFEVLGRVLGERLADIDARAVDQAVDAAEVLERVLDDTLSGVCPA